MKAFSEGNDRRASTVGLFSAEECEGDSTWIGDQGPKHLSSGHKWARIKAGFLPFFSHLGLTFTLAVNETKQRRVIRVNVLIRGFHRKPIS